MPVRIRLSRGGAKKRPFYRIVVADSRRARDGKFIDQVGTYNPMLPKDSAERVKIDLDKIEVTEELPLYVGNNIAGILRSAVYSPHFKKVVGIAMIKKEFWDKKTSFELKIDGKKSKGSICDLPLV